jgi:hypothetical protein
MKGNKVLLLTGENIVNNFQKAKRGGAKVESSEEEKDLETDTETRENPV